MVVYDHLASSRLLDLARPDAVRILAGKSIGHCILTQDEINELLIDNARAGRVVVRLKGGDPLVFGRGGEEASCLRGAGIPFEIVPGVTAGLGVTAYAGIPVTHRAAASAVAFVTGHGDPECDPIKSARLVGPGRLSGYACCVHGSHLSRGDLPHADSTGKTWRHAGRGDRIRHSSLAANSGRHSRYHRSDRASRRRTAPCSSDRRIGRRASGQACMVREPAAVRSANCDHPAPRRSDSSRGGSRDRWVPKCSGADGRGQADSPTLRPLDRSIDRLTEYDWLVFTSANGVRFFVRRLEERGRDLRALGHLKLAAIGPTTAEALAGFHLRADLVPESYRSEALAEALGQVAAGRKILLARADRGRTLLKDELEQLADVDQVAVYHNADVDVSSRSRSSSESSTARSTGSH